jgi:hypothetical protein
LIILKTMTEKSILCVTIKGESAVTESTFMEIAREVHLSSWHRDHFQVSVMMLRHMPLSE